MACGPARTWPPFCASRPSNRGALDLASGWWRIPAQLRRTVAHRRRRNSRANAQRNIAAHYDLGNDFYRLFLDESMTYSSAVFEADDQTLEAAQQAKYRRMAARAGLRPGMHVLEIGSGWGGFAVYAAGEIGCRVTTITISREQHALATARVAAAGLQDLVDVQLRDYRDVVGEFDAVVSIEMLEAVGHEFLGAYFEAVDRSLKPGARASIQVITFPDVAYETQRRGANWIQTYIFPGGLCPSLAVIERATARTNLLITDVDDIAPSYVRTLREWRTRFVARRPRGPGPGLRRPLHPDVGVLPRTLRGRVRDRRLPGPPARPREAPAPEQLTRVYRPSP